MNSGKESSKVLVLDAPTIKAVLAGARSVFWRSMICRGKSFLWIIRLASILAVLAPVAGLWLFALLMGLGLGVALGLNLFFSAWRFRFPNDLLFPKESAISIHDFDANNPIQWGWVLAFGVLGACAAYTFFKKENPSLSLVGRLLRFNLLGPRFDAMLEALGCFFGPNIDTWSWRGAAEVGKQGLWQSVIALNLIGLSFVIGLLIIPMVVVIFGGVALYSCFELFRAVAKKASSISIFDRRGLAHALSKLKEEGIETFAKAERGQLQKEIEKEYSGERGRGADIPRPKGVRRL